MKGWLLSGAAALVLPLVLSVVAFALTQGSKRAARWIDTQSAPVKQALALAWAAALTALARQAGRSVCLDGLEACAIDGVDWRLVASSSWAGALSLHGWRKKPPRGAIAGDG